MAVESSAARPQIRISMSCIADFINSPGKSPQSLLRPFKYPQKGEGLVRVTYYQPAVSAIRAYHSAGNDDSIIQRGLSEMQRQLDTAPDNRLKSKYRQNIEATESYRRLYANRKFKVLPNPGLPFQVGSVAVTAKPDLWVEERGTQVLIKIGAAKHGRRYIEMLLALLRKAAVKNGHRIRAKNIVYLEVSTGEEIICSGGLTRFNRDFARAAEKIAELWPTVTESGASKRPK